MAASDIVLFKSTDAELWIGGLRCSGLASSISIDSTWNQPNVTVLSDPNTRTQKVINSGNFQISLFYREERRLQAIMDYWDKQAPTDPLPVVWAMQGQIAVGRIAAAACVEPGESRLSGSAEDVFRLDLTATLAGEYVRGIVRSGLTGTNHPAMFSTDPAAYAPERINISSGTVFTTTYTEPRTEHALSAIIATTGSITGEDGERPVLTFNIPTGEDWEDGDLTVADAKSLTIGHTVNGVLVNKKVPSDRPNFYLHETTSSVYDAIEALTWDDGFRINVVPVSNPQGQETSVRFSGSQGGSDKDIVFAASNQIPTGGPFVGSDSGTDGGLTMQIFTATGTGGSTVRTGVGKAIAADGHDLPANLLAIIEEGFTQVGIAYTVPARTDASTWDFSPNYTIATITDGDV